MSTDGDAAPPRVLSVSVMIQLEGEPYQNAWVRLEWVAQHHLEALARACAGELALRARLRAEYTGPGAVDELREQIERQGGLVRVLMQQIRAAQRVVRVLTGHNPDVDTEPHEAP